MRPSGTSKFGSFLLLRPRPFAMRRCRPPKMLPALGRPYATPAGGTLAGRAERLLPEPNGIGSAR